MVKYNCQTCNYTTINKAHYDAHLNTKKHLRLMENNKPDKTCIECDKTFSTMSNYYKHMKKYHSTTPLTPPPTPLTATNPEYLFNDTITSDELKKLLYSKENELLALKKNYEILELKYEHVLKLLTMYEGGSKGLFSESSNGDQ